MKLFRSSLCIALLIGIVTMSNNVYAISKTQATWGSGIIGVAVGAGVAYGIFQYLQKHDSTKQLSQEAFINQLSEALNADETIAENKDDTLETLESNDSEPENIKTKLLNDSIANLFIALAAGIATGEISSFAVYKILDYWVDKRNINRNSNNSQNKAERMRALLAEMQRRSSQYRMPTEMYYNTNMYDPHWGYAAF